MALFNFLSRKKPELDIQTFSADGFHSNLSFMSNSSVCERHLYKTLKDNIPVIDAAIYKIIRLMGNFSIQTGSDTLDTDINRFLKNIRVNACETGITSFLSCYLEQMLVYGTAVGEIVLDRKHKHISALYNASLDNVQLISNGNPLDIKVCTQNSDGSLSEVKYPSLVLCNSIMPEPSHIYGTSVLKGLPFVGNILMKIFTAIGTNWDRVGNVRFAVSYKPNENERAFSKDRAKTIAEEWSKAMKSTSPKDFITVGDVSIKVIGADNQIPDSNIPVRQLLEQITAKLSIPPFLLGFSWSTTERMSTQQADILTSELEYYRCILNSTITKICDIYFRLNGIKTDFEIVWNNINLQDEVELARARLLNAQAQKLENSFRKD